MVNEMNRRNDSTRNQRLLAEARKKYIPELNQQLEMLENLLNALREEHNFIQAQQVYRILHTMKGSAPIFGFPQVGSLAQEFIHLWEWTQEHRGQAMEDRNPRAANDLIDKSEEFLMKLKIEYKINERESSGSSSSATPGQGLPSSHKARLLLIDDDDVFRYFIARHFQQDGYEVDEAGNVETAKRMLFERVYDLILLDLLMYPQTGYELFDFLKDDPTLKWIPLVVLSGRNDTKDKIRCLYLGADDYVVKPFEYEELEARVNRLLLRSRQFEQIAFRDALTGVYNRRYFDHQVQVEMQKAVRNQEPISIAFIDVDHFKNINDTYGHRVGDLVLQGVGHLLQQSIRMTDILARYGGEEFVIVFQANHAAAEIRVNHILEKIRKVAMTQHEGRDVFVTFSAGIAELQRGTTLEQWLRQADAALYQAKNQGRNRVVVSDGTLQAVKESEEQYALTPKRILVVDDDEILRAILVSLLSHLSFEIHEAKDGKEAAELLGRLKFDLCILDRVMPNMDGFELLSQIKANRNLSAMKILILSGQKKEEDIALGIQLGADDYMTKPFSLVEFEIRAKQLLGVE